MGEVEARPQRAISNSLLAAHADARTPRTFPTALTAAILHFAHSPSASSAAASRAAPRPGLGS